MLPTHGPATPYQTAYAKALPPPPVATAGVAERAPTASTAPTIHGDAADPSSSSAPAQAVAPKAPAAQAPAGIAGVTAKAQEAARHPPRPTSIMGAAKEPDDPALQLLPDSGSGDAAAEAEVFGGSRKRKPLVPPHDWDSVEGEEGNAQTRKSKRPRGSSEDMVLNLSNVSAPPAVAAPRPTTVAAPTTVRSAPRHKSAPVLDEGDELFSEADVFVVPARPQVSTTSSAAPSVTERHTAAVSAAPTAGVQTARAMPTGAARRSAFLASSPPGRGAAEEADAEGGWVSALRGEERARVAQSGRDRLLASRGAAHDENDGEGEREETRTAPSAVPAQEVERPTLLLRTPSSLYEEVAVVPLHINAGGGRNVKVFRKNAVRTVPREQKMSFTAMQVVLPKESEREIQVRCDVYSRMHVEYCNQRELGCVHSCGWRRRRGGRWKPQRTT
jgi:hypothetical protein